MNIDQHEIDKLTLDIFLGLSTGHWIPLHLPTRDNPILEMKYTGKKGKPFKLLYAAVRPSTPKTEKCSCGEASRPVRQINPIGRVGVKSMRPTIYFDEFVIKLSEQTIKFTSLKDSVPSDVMENLMRRGHKSTNVLDILLKDIEDCRVQAIAILTSRKMEHVEKPADPRSKIRRLAVKLFKALHPATSTPAEEDISRILDHV